MKNNLFAYGTLQCEDILQSVTSLRFQRSKGKLHGFRRRAVRGESFPGIIPEGGAEVRGTVYFDLPAPAWELLDQFEGQLYLRTTVPVILDTGGTVQAETYVVRAELHGMLDSTDWNLDRFIRHSKNDFLTERSACLSCRTEIGSGKSEQPTPAKNEDTPMKKTLD